MSTVCDGVAKRAANESGARHWPTLGGSRDAGAGHAPERAHWSRGGAVLRKSAGGPRPGAKCAHLPAANGAAKLWETGRPSRCWRIDKSRPSYARNVERSIENVSSVSSLNEDVDE